MTSLGDITRAKISAGIIDLPVVVLVGGLGTRLRSAVPDAPKALAPINGRPFLSYLLTQLAGFGLSEIILSVGYLSDQIISAFGSEFSGVKLKYSRETEPLGTGGAVRLALDGQKIERALVLNGDSFCSFDLPAFVASHESHQASLSMYLIPQSDTSRYGRVATDASGAVVSFAEKAEGLGAGWINAGIYLLNQKVIESIPPSGAVSIERQVFPEWVGRGMYGFKSEESTFIDIGTPESFVAAQKFFS